MAQYASFKLTTREVMTPTEVGNELTQAYIWKKGADTTRSSRLRIR